MDLAKESLEAKREIVNNMLERGIMPYTKVYLGHFNNHFSTIGICGMHEACLNISGKGIGTPEGRAFAVEILDFMRGVLKEFQEETGNLYNLEATPAESTSYRLARLDKQKYPQIVTSGTEKHPYLTNSTQLNVDATRDVFEALQHQEEVQPLYTGGTIFHTFLPEAIDGETCRKLVQKIAETRIPVLQHHPDVQRLREPRLSQGPAADVPGLRDFDRGLLPDRGLSAAGQNLERRQAEEFKDRTPYTAIG